MDRFQRTQSRKTRFAPPEGTGAPDERPLVLVESGAKGIRITAANEAAEDAGAFAGQALADARASCPGLRAEPADRTGDAAMLEVLGTWAMRYSPIVAVDAKPEGAPGLFIDTTGCDHLFGGEEALVSDCLNRIEKAGFTVRAGLASTPGLAWALACFGSGSAIVLRDIAGDATLPDEARALPVAALRLSEDRRVLLNRLGLKTVDALFRVPRHALERRFRSREAARSVQMRLDQLTGAIAEPLVPLYPPPPYRTSLSVGEPVINTGAVVVVLEDLLVRMHHRLDHDGKGARVFRLTAFRTDGGSGTVTVRLSQPGRAVAAILRLFSDRLEEIDCGFGIDGFALAAEDIGPVDAHQEPLAAGFASSGCHGGENDGAVFCDGLAPLTDVLSNRLGAARVYRLAPSESHWPERATRRVAGDQAVAWQPWLEAAVAQAERPFRLFDRPEAVTVMAQVPDGPPLHFTWRRVKRTVKRARGPERIAPEWWRADAKGTATRDYFVVEDTEGRRYWLYRSGVYRGDDVSESMDETDAPAFPRWYVHGLFL